MRLGIDVGSTTVKLILLDKFDKIVYEKYVVQKQVTVNVLLINAQ